MAVVILRKKSNKEVINRILFCSNQLGSWRAKSCWQSHGRKGHWVKVTLIGKPVHAGEVWHHWEKRWGQDSKGNYLRSGMPGKVNHGRGNNTYEKHGGH